MRHELKHRITYEDYLVISSRLRYIADFDSHAGADGLYRVHSLYFDNISDKILREKLDGVCNREKFRIRYYNEDTSLIHLEKKSKIGGLGKKQSAGLTAAQAQDIVNGSLDWMADSSEELIYELYVKMRTQGLRPKTIVDYMREPFIFGPGNVRVTLDYHIRTGSCCGGFLNPDCPTIPAGESPIILEVKWDSYLPDIIRDAVRLPGRRVTAFSKYAQCRIYG